MDTPLRHYKYQRKCRLARCRADFGTNRKKQKFCQDLHRIEYHEVKRKRIVNLQQRLRRSEKELQRIIKLLAEATNRAAHEARSLAALRNSIKGGEAPKDKKRKTGRS